MTRRGMAGGMSVLALAVLAALAVPPARGQGEAGTAARWRVASRGLDWPLPLTRLEIRRASPLGESVVIAFRSDDAGAERVWGSGRISLGPSGAGPARAEWVEGDENILLQLRPIEAGGLEAVVRLRDRKQTGSGPERVRSATLVPDAPAADQEPPAILGLRPEPIRRREELWELDTMAIDGTGLKALARPSQASGFARAAYPSWSPDGTRIAFTAFGATGRDPLIRIVAADGGPTVAVASGVGPRFSRRGDRLAYMASGRAVFATDWNAPGRNDERIEAVRLAGPQAGSVEVLARGLWPRWSPIDDRLAFIAKQGQGWDLFVRSEDGSDVVRLTDDLANDTFPSWTPDGSAIVFLSDRGNRWDLHEIPADGRGGPRRLTNLLRREDHADLSPDGLRVAYTHRLGRPDCMVEILELASGLVRPMGEGREGDREPSWSPDGRRIAFVSRRPAPGVPDSDR